MSSQTESKLNTSMLISSFKYLKKFELIVSASALLNQELSITKYSNYKLSRSFDRNDFEVARSIIPLHCKHHNNKETRQPSSFTERRILKINNDQNLLNNLLVNTFSFTISKENSDQRIIILIDAGADIHYDNDKLFDYACRYGSTELLRRLLKTGIDPCINNNKALHDIVSTGNIESLKLLLDYGVDLKFNSEIVFKLALTYCRQNIEMVRFLLSLDLDIPRNAMSYPADYRNLELAKSLFEKGVKITAKSIIIASKSFYPEVYQFLLDNASEEKKTKALARIEATNQHILAFINSQPNQPQIDNLVCAAELSIQQKLN